MKLACPMSATRGERNDVMQLFRRVFEKTADIARGLADTLLIFHQRDPNKVFSVFPEANAR